MDSDRTVLCGASAYKQKYFFNQDFLSLPQAIQEELKILCVLFTEEIGGTLTLYFDGAGDLQFQVEALAADALFDDIGSELKIRQLQQTKQELLRSLELYYQSFFLGDQL